MVADMIPPSLLREAALGAPHTTRYIGVVALLAEPVTAGCSAVTGLK